MFSIEYAFKVILSIDLMSICVLDNVNVVENIETITLVFQ